MYLICTGIRVLLYLWWQLTLSVSVCITAYERAIREDKIRTEFAQAKREREFYLSKVDQAKALKAITTRKRKHQFKRNSTNTMKNVNITHSDVAKNKTKTSHALHKHKHKHKHKRKRKRKRNEPEKLVCVCCVFVCIWCVYYVGLWIYNQLISTVIYSDHRYTCLKSDSTLSTK